MDSILTSVKKLMGIDEEYDAFDKDLIIHINSVLMILTQLGVGTPYFTISGSGETWDDFMGGDARIESVKTYVYQKVRMIFDPPTSGTHVQALEKSINEFEWRLELAANN